MSKIIFKCSTFSVHVKMKNEIVNFLNHICLYLQDKYHFEIPQEPLHEDFRPTNKTCLDDEQEETLAIFQLVLDQENMLG